MIPLQVFEEQLTLELEQETWASDSNNIDNIIHMTMDDFPEDKVLNAEDRKLFETADSIAKHSITDKTRAGHIWLVFGTILYFIIINIAVILF
jgi:hypothetical protein